MTRILYSQKEIEAIDTLAADSISPKEIAQYLNTEFWDGKSVRNANGVKNNILYRSATPPGWVKKSNSNSVQIQSTQSSNCPAKEVRHFTVQLLKSIDNLVQENNELKQMLRDLKDIRQAVENFQKRA